MILRRQGMTGSPPNRISLPHLTLVIGGARSGKSGFAERLVRASGLPRHYIATAEAWDDEMAARIARHQADRGADWTTHHAALNPAAVLATLPSGEVALLDCATLWLTNILLGKHDIEAASASLLDALTTSAAPVVVVSNEVGWGIVPENALARAFRDHQGRLNQAIAARADLVVTVMAGLPLALKGQLVPLT